MNIYNAQQTEDRIKAFCRYIIFVDFLMPNMITKNNMIVFLVQNILHTLINLIRNNNSDLELKLATCSYLKKLLGNILPECVESSKKILVLIINILIPIARDDTLMGRESLSLLEFLVIDNAVILSEVIQDLDPFPQEHKFQRICNVYQRLRYENVSVTLENEIKHFLNAGNIMEVVGCREEGLKCLRKQLSTKKDELKKLYGELYKLRGFSEDTHGSILHQLVCMLVKLTTSDNPTVSTKSFMFIYFHSITKY